MTPTDLPAFEASWWPVVLDTVPGAEEKLVIGVIARAESGQSQARQVVGPATLNAMFGSAGKGMQLIVSSTVIAIQSQLDEGVRVEELQYPYGGLHLGRARDCVAHDLNEVFEVAVKLSSAFGTSTFGQADVVAKETQEAFDEWAVRIRNELLAVENRLHAEALFNVRVQLATRKKSQIGFIRGSYAANFGVLRPGHGSADTRALKVKLFDLGAYRRLNPLLVRQAEVIVGCPQISQDAYPRREVESLEASWRFLEDEARARDIRTIRCVSARQAADYLLKAAA